jgi:hypothetical protein
MTTALRKPVSRLTETAVRDRGRKFRQIVVSLLPGDVIELRLKGTRFAAAMAISSVWYEAITRKALAEAKQKRAERKARREARGR